MLSVTPKESAVLSIKYQYFLILPGLAIAVSLLLILCSKLLLSNGLMSLKKSSKAKNLHSACADTDHQAGRDKPCTSQDLDEVAANWRSLLEVLNIFFRIL